MENEECVSEFRFEKKDIYILGETLEIPESTVCYNGTKVDGIESLCIFLRRFAYPCRYLDMISCLGKPVPELCLVSNHVINFVYDRWGHLLKTMNQQWLAPVNLQLFTDTVYASGSQLHNCWGFINGTVRPICRPRRDQRILCDGHKKVQVIKFQSVVPPNGLIANLYGPVKRRRHGSCMVDDSGLICDLQQYTHGPKNNILCLHGNPAYPVRPQLMGPFQGAARTSLQNSGTKP